MGEGNEEFEDDVFASIAILMEDTPLHRCEAASCIRGLPIKCDVNSGK